MLETEVIPKNAETSRTVDPTLSNKAFAILLIICVVLALAIFEADLASKRSAGGNRSSQEPMSRAQSAPKRAQAATTRIAIENLDKYKPR
jgi:hypothetical protein